MGKPRLAVSVVDDNRGIGGSRGHRIEPDDHVPFCEATCNQLSELRGMDSGGSECDIDDICVVPAVSVPGVFCRARVDAVLPVQRALATAFILLIPYAIAIMWMVLVDRGAQIHRLKAELERASGTAEEPQVEMFNFYDERGELKLSVKPEMLYYIEAADNYVQICYTNAGKIEKLMVRNTLKNVEWRFRDKGLVRCHRSYVVNVKNVKLFRRQESEVLLEFGDSRVPSIPVSKGFGDRVMAELS